MRTEPVVSVVRADLESSGRDDEPLTGKLCADSLAAPPSPCGSRKLIRKARRVRRPALDDELLEGV